ncbi:MAG TPA: hypothetical protein VHA80_02580 [Solirubrobacterales bacterium]|nr:hypothetical protein [Solirubrobacterales bacterium]
MSGAPEGGGSARDGAGKATFDADLRLLRRRVVRRWALAVAARYAVGALAIAVVPALLAALGVIGWVWAIALPAAVFVVALAARLSRAPSLAQVARLLDDRLGLFDVTATALQVERSGEPVDEGPAAPVFAEAAALLRAGASDWRPRARLGRGELVAAGGLVVVLAAIAVVGSSGGGSGSTKVTATSSAAGARHHAAGARDVVSPPLVPPRAKRKGARSPANPAERHPYGLYVYGFEGRRELPRYHSKGEHQGVRYAGGRPPGSGRPPSQFAAPGAAEGSEAREKAEAEATQVDAQRSAGGRKESRGEPPPGQTLKSLTGGAAPPSGSVSPLPNASSGGPPSAGNRPSAPASSGAPGARSAAGAPGQRGGGRPSGGRTAGAERAPLGAGARGGEGGRTAGELALKAGFAAVRSGKAATGRGPRDAQGAGGPGKSAGIGGAAFEEAGAGALGYVPPDAGIAPTRDPGLLARYLNALTAIEGRRW